MFATVLTQVTGLFASGHDFVRTYFFPLLVWTGGIAMVAIGSVGAVELRLAAFDGLAGGLQAGVVVAWIALVALLASMLASMRLRVLRLFEGHWPAWATFLRRRLVARQAQALPALGDGPDQAARTILGAYYDHPVQHETVGADGRPVSPRVELQPTRLGNMVRAAEDYPSRRYGMNGVLLWPRLFRLLPEELKSDLDAAQRAIDAALTVALLAASFGVLGGGLALRAGVPWWSFAAVWFGSWALAGLGYRSALAAALSYTELVRTAFDLHRGDLLVALGFAEAEPVFDSRRPMESRELWETIGNFVLRGTEAFPRRPWPVPVPPAATSSPTTGTLEVHRTDDGFVATASLQEPG